jgi:hypothetical protein
VPGKCIPDPEIFNQLNMVEIVTSKKVARGSNRVPCTAWLLLLLFIVTGVQSRGQVSIVTPYPAATGNLTRGGIDTSSLTVQLAFGSACSSVQTTVTLPAGVSYVPGSITKTGGSAAFAIAYAGGTASAPVFAISGVGTPGDIIFSLKRTAACGGTGAGKDIVSVTSSCGNASESNTNVNAYTIYAPSLSLTAPAGNLNANVGSAYLRTVAVTNGGNGCLDTFNYFMVLPAGKVGLVDSVNYPVSVQLNGGSLPAVDFLPVRSSGDTLFYRIFGANAFGSDLRFCNGEVVNIRENVLVKTCGSNTAYYGAYWGRSGTSCQQAAGSAVITTANTAAGFAYKVGIAPALGGCIAPSYTLTDSLTNNGTVGVYYTRFTITNSVAASNVYIDTASIQIAYTGTPPYHPASGIAVTSTNTNTQSCIQGKPQNVSFTLPSRFILPVGASVAVTYNVITGCRDSSSCTASYTAGSYTVTHGYTLLCDNTALTRSSNSQSIGYSVRVSAFAMQTPAMVRYKEEFTVKVPVVFSIPTSPAATIARRIGYVNLAMPSGLTLVSASEALDTGTNISFSMSGTTASYRFIPNVTTKSHYILLRLRNDSACGYQPLVARASIILDSSCSPETRVIASQCYTNVTKYKCPPSGTGSCPGTNGPNFSFGRSSFGAPDNNMDGRADATGSLDPARVDPDRYMIGDTLRSISGASITARGAAPLDTFAYVYAEWNFPVGTWAPAGAATVTLKRGNTTWTCSNVPITTLTANRIFRADWKAASCMTGFGSYRTGDSVSISASFRLSDATYITGAEVGAKNGTAYDYSKDVVSKLAHLIYASNNSAPPAGGSIGIGTGNTPGYACDTALYNAYLTGWRHVLSSAAVTATGCSNVTKAFTSTTSVVNTSSGGQYFTGEYRPIAVPDTFLVTLPAGWEYVSPLASTMVYTTKRGSSITATYTIAPGVSVNGQGQTQLLFDYTTAFANGTIPDPGTEGVVYTTNYSVRPASCSTPANAKDSVVEFGHLNDPYGVSFRRYSIFTAASNTMNYGTRAVLSLSNTTGTVTANTPANYWDIQISNSAVTASNIWLALDQSAGTITIDSVALLNSGGTATTGLLTTLRYGAGKTWYQVAGTLAASANQKARIYFRYANCLADSVRAFSGYDCLGYPASPESPGCSGLVSADVYLKALSRPSEIQLSVARQPGNGSSVGLCSTDSVVFIVNSAQPANIVNPRVQVILPAGMSVVTPFPVEYPLGSNNWQSIAGTEIQGGYEINLSNHTGIGASGLKGTALNPAAAGRQAKVKVSFNTGCAYRSGSTVTMYGYANRTCGTPATGDGTNVKSLPLDISGIPSGGGTISMAMSLPTTTIGCSGTATISLVSIPLAGPTQGEDSVIYTLPSGIGYGGNFVADSNCGSCVVTTAPGTLQGTTDVKVKLPPSLPANTRIKYSFDLTGAGSGCGSATIEATAVRTYPGLFCGATQCSNSTKVVGNSVSGTIVREKPQLSLSGLSLLGGTYQPGQTVAYKLDYQNAGGAGAAANAYRAEFYRSASDTPFAVRYLQKALAVNTSTSDTLSLAIPAAASRGETVSVKLQTQMFSGARQCMCASSAYLYAVPLPLTLLDFNAVKRSGAVDVAWRVASDQGISSYIVERSTDGSLFSAAGVVAARGGAAEMLYAYPDAGISGVKTLYYRLRLVSTGGGYSFSEIARVDLEADAVGLAVLPTPASNTASLRWTGIESDQVRIRIFDAMGRVVLDRSDRLAGGAREVQLPEVSGMPAGTYTVRLTIASRTLVTRMTVTK